MRFPAGFLWGTATAAYQIEGAVREGGRGASVWDTFSHTPGRTWHGDTGDIACDHFHRLEADLNLMASLGHTAYRFSVAWSRIQPNGRGEPNQVGLDFYRRLVDGLQRRHITPLLTLYHWDLPQALEDAGGWLNRDTAQRFVDYAGHVYAALGDAVPLWLTLNEPQVAAWAGYGWGLHAPGRRDDAAALTAVHHLLLAHGLGLQALRAVQRPETQLGVTNVVTSVQPAPDDPGAPDVARHIDGIFNRLYLDALFKGEYPSDVRQAYAAATDFGFVRAGDMPLISAPLDFLGLNYYTRVYATTEAGGHGVFPHTRRPDPPTTSMGWAIVPDGLTEVLVRVRDEYTRLPIYITESGVACDDYVTPEGEVRDAERIAYLDAHFRAAHAAIEQGVDLRGYFVWSLLDNFEWAEGYRPRFGLVFTDYGTQRRLPKQSAHWFRQVIARNGLE